MTILKPSKPFMVSAIATAKAELPGRRIIGAIGSGGFSNE